MARRGRARVGTETRSEYVDVFKTLKLDDPFERQRMRDLGHLAQVPPPSGPRYYNIEVTGTTAVARCHR